MTVPTPFFLPFLRDLCVSARNMLGFMRAETRSSRRRSGAAASSAFFAPLRLRARRKQSGSRKDAKPRRHWQSRQPPGRRLLDKCWKISDLSSRMRTERRRGAGDSAPSAPDFEPVKLRYRHDGLTPARQVAVVQAMAACGCIREACAKVGISHEAVYELRRRPDAQSFRARHGHRPGRRRRPGRGRRLRPRDQRRRGAALLQGRAGRHAPAL